MSPLTLGVYAFHEQLRLLLHEPPPGRQASSMVRVIVEGVGDKQLLQAIRLYERDPSNLRSFTLHTASFDDERRFLDGARRQLQADADSVRAWSARAGKPLQKHEFPTFANVDEFARGVVALESRLHNVLDGVVVGLLPDTPNSSAVVTRVLQALARVARHPRLVVLVKDDGSEALKRLVPHEIALRVDANALWKHLRDPKGPNQAGPARAEAPKLTPEARRELERTTGQRMLGEDNGRVLRHLLADAGQAFAEGRLEPAATAFRKARTYCRMLGLHAEAATCAIGVGTSRFALGQKDLAIRAYEEGLSVAVAQRLPHVALQAHLGIATTQLSMGAYAKARDAYARAAETAPDNATVRVECLRMRGVTFAHEGRPGDAVVAWLDALGAVEKLAPLARSTTAYKLVVEHLVDALPKAARRHDVPGIRARGEAIEGAVLAAVDEARAAHFAEVAS